MTKRHSDETNSSATRYRQQTYGNLTFNERITVISATEYEIEIPFPPPFWTEHNDELESGYPVETDQVPNPTTDASLSEEQQPFQDPNAQNEEICQQSDQNEETSNQCEPHSSVDVEMMPLLPVLVNHPDTDAR